MNRFLKFCLGFISLVAVVACSDDDGPKPASREIVKVDIYQAEDDDFSLKARYQLAYDVKGHVSSVRLDSPVQEVSYSYGTGNISYRWDGNDASNGTFIHRFEAELRNGYVFVGSLNSSVNSESQTYNYSYHYNNAGYLLDATFGGSQMFSYLWSKKSLTIKGHPSAYDGEYIYSRTANDYSIDLNVLPLLVDARTDVMLAMNAYAQLAGVLGKRYPYFMEDADYSYSYMFDAEGRLAQIVQQPTSMVPDKQLTYWFQLSYEE